MKIRIVIWSTTKNYSVFADDSTNEITFGLQKKNEGAQTFVRQAIQIVKDWPDQVEDKNILDGISYKIAYDDGNVVRQLIGNNKVPEGFSTLLYLIQRNEPNNLLFLAKEEQEIRKASEAWDFLRMQ